MLKKSVETISQVNNIQNGQNQIIKKTISVSENIDKCIDEENWKFSNIDQMIQGNTKEIQMLSEQVDMLNHMVRELEELLEEYH